MLQRAGFAGHAESASYGEGRGGRTPELRRERLNPLQTGSHLQGCNSGLVRAKGQTVLNGHLVVVLCPYRRATVAASEVVLKQEGDGCPQQAGSPALYGFKGPLPLYSWAGGGLLNQPSSLLRL